MPAQIPIDLVDSNRQVFTRQAFTMELARGEDGRLRFVMTEPQQFEPNIPVTIIGFVAHIDEDFTFFKELPGGPLHLVPGDKTNLDITFGLSSFKLGPFPPTPG